MQRRALLLAGASTAAAATAAFAWPGWLRGAFASKTATVAPTPPITAEGEPCQGAMKKPEPPRQPEGKCSAPEAAAVVLKRAAAQARAQGKKLLILSIPTDPGLSYNRGTHLGEFLNHAGDRGLAPLSKAIVACASPADLNAALGASIQGEPVMIVFDPETSAAQPFDTSLKATDAYTMQPHETVESRTKRFERESDARIQKLSALVEQALGAVPEAEVAARAAAVRQTIVQCPPPGARWGNAAGCGSSFEDEAESDRLGVACGMGQIPARSQRFLSLFTGKKTG